MNWRRFFRQAPKERVPSPYGDNPYDSYTWELHRAPNGQVSLERTQGFDRTEGLDRNKPDGESFNPYESKYFSGGW